MSEPQRNDGQRVGQTIAGKYRLERLLGGGGMGAVYAAENTWTQRRVALKVMRPEVSMHAGHVQRFIQEARSAAVISHPNIIEILDAGQEPDDGALFIVQELLAGMDLAAYLERRGRIPLPEALAIMLPIVDALCAAHDRGIIHRDIKPENIFLARDARDALVPKLIDFGISKVADREQALARTNTGVALGTPYYMSPEQARGDATLDGRADVWSVGAVLFEMLSGRVPFDAANYNLLIVKLLTEPPPRLVDVAPDMPEAMRRVVDGALTPDRAQRVASMRALREALRGVGVAVPDVASLGRTLGDDTGARADRAAADTLAASGENTIPPSESVPGATVVPLVRRASSREELAETVSAEQAAMDASAPVEAPRATVARPSDAFTAERARNASRPGSRAVLAAGALSVLVLGAGVAVTSRTRPSAAQPSPTRAMTAPLEHAVPARTEEPARRVATRALEPAPVATAVVRVDAGAATSPTEPRAEGASATRTAAARAQRRVANAAPEPRSVPTQATASTATPRTEPVAPTPAAPAAAAPDGPATQARPARRGFVPMRDYPSGGGGS